MAPEQTYYRPANKPVAEVTGDEVFATAEEVAEAFFAVDGMSSRALMPYPHYPFREPAHWKRYDHLTVRQRLDELDLPQTQKDIFETLTNSFGSSPGSVTGFTEVLRWYALAGHSMARVFEMAGVYKIGKGGMTSLARAILDDFRGDILLNAEVGEVAQDNTDVVIRTRRGQQVRAKVVVSTIPL